MIERSLGGLTSQLKTVALLGALGGLLVVVGGVLGGQTGLLIALVMAVVLNVGVYWFSDRLALKANSARPLQPGEAPQVERIVRDLSGRAGIPMPSLYLIERPEPNAFATGRGPGHAAVAVTTGILEVMDERQLRGVLAHEISHVTNRDMLVGTVAATIGAAVSYLGNMALWSSFFGGNDEDSVPAPILLLGAILAPIAATIIQLAVSRDREYGADRSGATLTHGPEGLASALEKLQEYRRPVARQNTSMAHMWFADPSKPGWLERLFATHPPLEARIQRLRDNAEQF